MKYIILYIYFILALLLLGLVLVVGLVVGKPAWCKVSAAFLPWY
jgi:hypothetical protein